MDGAGTSGSCTLWQRINVMQVMRSLSFEAYLVHYLFCCFDLVQDAKLKVVQEMSNKFAAIVDSAARLASDPGDDDPLHSIASLYQTRANSTSYHLPQTLSQSEICPSALWQLDVRSRLPSEAFSLCSAL